MLKDQSEIPLETFLTISTAVAIALKGLNSLFIFLVNFLNSFLGMIFLALSRQILFFFVAISSLS